MGFRTTTHGTHFAVNSSSLNEVVHHIQCHRCFYYLISDLYLVFQKVEFRSSVLAMTTQYYHMILLSWQVRFISIQKDSNISVSTVFYNYVFYKFNEVDDLICPNFLFRLRYYLPCSDYYTLSWLLKQTIFQPFATHVQ